MKTIKIQGVDFEVSDPYTAGHTLTEAEAKTLNQVRAENVRNNTAKIVAAAKEKNPDGLPDEVLTELREKIGQYDREYEFTMSTGGNGATRITDPVEREAMNLARTALRAKIKQEGKKLLKADHEGEPGANEITKARFDELVAQVAARDDVQKLARKRVKDEQALINV